MKSDIRTVAQGDALLAPTVTRRLLEEFLRGAGAEASLHGITARELECCGWSAEECPMWRLP